MVAVMNNMRMPMNEVVLMLDGVVVDLELVLTKGEWPRENMRRGGPLANEVGPVTRERARVSLMTDEVGAVAATGGARREICP